MPPPNKLAIHIPPPTRYGSRRKTIQQTKQLGYKTMIYTKAKLTITHYDGDGNEIEELRIKGTVDNFETTVEYPYGYRETTVTIRDNNTKQLPIGARPQQKIPTEDDNMSVKIKKQPIQITLEELQKGEEYEKVIIYIDEKKKEEIENKYGIHYTLLRKNTIKDTTIEFKEHYIKTNMNNIPYEIITDIEVIEK